MTAVLIIEDQVRLAKNIQTYLNRSGFKVRKSISGLDGLREFKRCRSDIVLLDVHLPDLSGLEVMRRLRNLDPRVRVILMSAMNMAEFETVARMAGAYECLPKPLVLKELKKLLQAAAP